MAQRHDGPEPAAGVVANGDFTCSRCGRSAPPLNAPEFIDWRSLEPEPGFSLEALRKGRLVCPKCLGEEGLE